MGYKLAGMGGAFFATVGMILPSFLLLFADWGNDFQPKMQQYMQSGLPDIMIGNVTMQFANGSGGFADGTLMGRACGKV